MEKRKWNKPLLSFLFSTLIISAIASLYIEITTPKIGFVRSDYLVDRFMGTREARAKFEDRKNYLLSNVDSMKLIYEKTQSNYLINVKRFNAQDRREQENLLENQREQLIKYSEVINQKIIDEDDRMMQEVLNQINSFVKEYAKEHGYDLILGTTLSGSILYGADSHDITEKLLFSLNERYVGK